MMKSLGFGWGLEGQKEVSRSWSRSVGHLWFQGLAQLLSLRCWLFGLSQASREQALIVTHLVTSFMPLFLRVSNFGEWALLCETEWSTQGFWVCTVCQREWQPVRVVTLLCKECWDVTACDTVLICSPASLPGCHMPCLWVWELWTAGVKDTDVCQFLLGRFGMMAGWVASHVRDSWFPNPLHPPWSCTSHQARVDSEIQDQGLMSTEEPNLPEEGVTPTGWHFGGILKFQILKSLFCQWLSEICFFSFWNYQGETNPVLWRDLWIQIFECFTVNENICFLGLDSPELCYLLFCKLPILQFPLKTEDHSYWHLPLGTELLGRMLRFKRKKGHGYGMQQEVGKGRRVQTLVWKDYKACEGKFPWSSGKLPAVGNKTLHSQSSSHHSGPQGIAFMEEESLGTKWKETAFEEQLKSC